MKNNIGAFKKKWIENPSDEDEMVELDTAQLDFSSEREDYYLNLNHFCEESIEMLGNSSEEEYWILQMI